MFDMTSRWLKSIWLHYSAIQLKSKPNPQVIKPRLHIADRLDHILNIYFLETTFLLLQNASNNQNLALYNNIIRVEERSLLDKMKSVIYD